MVGFPISHPKMIIFSRKTPWVVGETHHFRKPPFQEETPNNLPCAKPHWFWFLHQDQIRHAYRMLVVSTNPFETYAQVKLDHFPKVRAEHTKSLSCHHLDTNFWLRQILLTATFHYTGCLIGILIMVYYNPYIIGQYNPLYNLNNQGFFTAQPKRID